MANVYISFLGTNDYLLCHYQHQGNEPCPEPVRFVQEATMAMSCGSWGSEDSIVIFTTEEAEKRNWWDNGHCDRKTNAALCREGLKARLEKMGLKAPVRCVRIPEGHDETQIWAIFEKIFEEMKAGDRIVFDITHAFRSIPLLATVVLHYAKVMRAIQVAGIYYGAFEVLGDYQTVKDMAVEERIAPILDLGALDQLMDWTIATDRFIKTGDPGLVADLAKSQVGPILRESRGRNEAAQAIKKLSDTLKQFHLGLATCRGPELAVGARKVKEQATRCRGLDLHPPFRPLFERIEQRLDAFADDSLQAGLAAVRWCSEHGLIQQGFTILEETLICLVLTGVDGDPQDVTLRDVASQSFAILGKKIENCREKWQEPAKSNPEMVGKMIAFIRATAGLEQRMDRVRQARNDLNHAGYHRNAKKLGHAGSFATDLADHLDGIERLFRPDGMALATDSR